jgi:hypothetical protein
MERPGKGKEWRQMSSTKSTNDPPTKRKSLADDPRWLGIEPAAIPILEEFERDDAVRAVNREERKAHRDMIRAVMTICKVKRRQAAYIVDDGTSDPKRAKMLANAFPDREWYTPAIIGRPAKVGRTIDNLNVPGCDFRDYLFQPERPAHGSKAWRAFGHCRRLYLTGALKRHRFASVASLIEAVDFSEGVEALWTEYRSWRWRRLEEIDTAESLLD